MASADERESPACASLSVELGQSLMPSVQASSDSLHTVFYRDFGIEMRTGQASCISTQSMTGKFSKTGEVIAACGRIAATLHRVKKHIVKFLFPLTELLK